MGFLSWLKRKMQPFEEIDIDENRGIENSNLKQDYKKEEDNKQEIVIERKTFEDYLESIPQIPIIPNDNAEKLKRQNMIEFPELKFSAITKATNLDKISNFVVLDTETTGIKIGGNRIIELSAIKFKDFFPEECFSTLINPKMSIPSAATCINRITNTMVDGKPELYQVKEAFLDFVGKYPLIGHNISFDLRHLFASGIDLTSHKLIDTILIAKKLLKSYKDNDSGSLYGAFEDYDVDNYQLDTLCEYYGLRRFSSHNSLSDCLATGFLFISLLDDRRDDFDRTQFCDEILGI